MVSRNNAGFVLALLIAIFVTSRAFAASVYFVGGSDDDGLGSSDFAQFPHDGFVLEHLQDLGHDVFYQSGNNSTTEFASNFDLLVISATLGSGSVRGKFHSVSTPILQWEEALMHVQAGNFPITVETGDANHGTDSRAREIVITNNAHFITQGFPLGPIEIAKLDADQDIAMPWAANIVEEVTSLATHPELTERHVLTAFEAGTEWADNTIAPMNMVNFPIQDHDFGNLNELGLLLFDNSIAWLLEVSGNPVPHIWDVDASGVWNEANNWSKRVVPDGVHEAVRFGGAITDDRNVSISRSVVVSLVEFDNANSYHINGPGSLTLQSDTGNATVVVRQGNHAINADMTFNSATDVTTAGGGLEFRGNLNLNGVTVNSAARAVLIGKSISGSGAFHGRAEYGRRRRVSLGRCWLHDSR